ncbi:MAG TPA: hypothetical protein VNS09_25260 [Solirubrobacter sp.]|nr:hypothetical protein [Solirubrobacter sp.]
MTEIPALRDALVRAGARRRRRRRTVGAAVPVLAVAAAVLALVSLPGRAPERERVAQTPVAPLPDDALARAYAVFRRPQTTADVLPKRALAGAVVDAARSRLVATAGDTRLFAVPADLRGTPNLCVVEVTPRHSAAACNRLPEAAGEAQPPGLSGSGGYAFLFPDGTHDVRITLADGTRLAPTVHDGAVLETAGASDFAIASWTGASGTRHISANEFARYERPPEACPALEPLPADAQAQAERVALLDVDRFYPGVEAARVTGVRVPDGTPCGSGERSLEVSLALTPSDPKARSSASLSQGRLLLGVVGGELRVYQLLH